VHVSGSVGAGNSITFTLRKNAADTPLMCTITDPAVDCSDTSALDATAYAATDFIDLKAVVLSSSGTAISVPTELWSISY
jgi:hypothetical protein